MKEHKLFGKFNDLVLLIIGFGLTTLIGTTISSNYQKKEWDRQNEIVKSKEQRDKAEEIYKELSQLIDYRLYRTRRLNWDERSGDSQLEFDSMLNDWNSKLNSNLALLEIYFGKDAMNHFSQKIAKNFRHLYEMIALADYSSPTKVEEINNKINKLNLTISWFNKRMIWAIRDRNVGENRKRTILTN